MERKGSPGVGRMQHILVAAAALSWANMVTMALAFTTADYASALDKSLLFYDVQRSGRLPSWQRIEWRANSALNDGGEVNLTGGYYDAGDNVKFGLPMAFTITLLAWNVVEFGDNFRSTGQLQNALNNIRWGTDYLLRCYTSPTELWVQVGEPNSDHSCWMRPEDMDTPRTAYKVDASHPGSDVGAETAAAFAAASMAFRRVDTAYSNTLLASAKRVDYILGNNPKSLSYMVGFSPNYPQQPHHRAASLPSISAFPQKITCGGGFTYFNSPNPNPNVATGAIVGGPDQDDNLDDVRSYYQGTEPTTYINAPIVGVLAVLATTPAPARLPAALRQFGDPMQSFLTAEFYA